MNFKLDEKLAQDLVMIKDLKLSQLMLMPDAENPWCVLVPRVNNVSEIYQLTNNEQAVLMEEISSISKMLVELFRPDKINIGALGNVVPQLHIHIICRWKNDRAWPNAIWGTKSQEDNEKVNNIKNLIVNAVNF